MISRSNKRELPATSGVPLPWGVLLFSLTRYPSIPDFIGIQPRIPLQNPRAWYYCSMFLKPAATSRHNPTPRGAHALTALL
jgi:hypothetical protein